MLIRIYQIKHTKDFSTTSKVDQKIVEVLPKLKEVIRKPSYEEVAEQLQRLSSVLQCDFPDDIGLAEYFKILAQYPKVLLEECVEYVLQTVRYRKLPLPYDFVSHMMVSSTVHERWLENLENKYINFKE
jgi:hypothetical protein